MKALIQILKWALITMLAFTSFNLFISPEYKVERSVEINVPAYIVYEQVTDLHQWENWAVWWKNDTSMITNYSGAERGLGAKMDWIGSDEMKAKIKEDFMRAGTLNANSFPTIILQHGGQYHAVAKGYSTADKMIKRVESILE